MFKYPKFNPSWNSRSYSFKTLSITFCTSRSSFLQSLDESHVSIEELFLGHQHKAQYNIHEISRSLIRKSHMGIKCMIVVANAYPYCLRSCVLEMSVEATELTHEVCDKLLNLAESRDHQHPNHPVRTKGNALPCSDIHSRLHWEHFHHHPQNIRPDPTTSSNTTTYSAFSWV